MSVVQFKKNYEISTNSTENPEQSVESLTISNISFPFLSKQRISEDFNNTDIEHKSDEKNVSESSPLDRVYPHIFDDQTPAGHVLIQIKNSIDQASIALEAYSEGDMGTVHTQLTNIAASMTNASIVDFNRSLSAAISFVRRATLTTPADSIDRPALNALVNVLNSLSKNPMINLDDASELTEKLTHFGWTGQLDIIENLVAAILDVREDETPQAELFSEDNSYMLQGDVV